MVSEINKSMSYTPGVWSSVAAVSEGKQHLVVVHQHLLVDLHQVGQGDAFVRVNHLHDNDNICFKMHILMQ